jgi:hypothetical protein
MLLKEFGKEAQDLEDTRTILAGSPERGWFEIEVTVRFELTTYH